MFNKCDKCKDNLIKIKQDKPNKLCLYDYKYDENKCVNCNAANSIIHALKNNYTLTLDDLKCLPTYVRFDDTNPEEIKYANEYKDIIKKYETKAMQL